MPISFAICVCVFPAAYSCITRRSRKAFVLVNDRRRFCGTALGLADSVCFVFCLTDVLHRSSLVNNRSEFFATLPTVGVAAHVARKFLLIIASNADWIKT